MTRVVGARIFHVLNGVFARRCGQAVYRKNPQKWTPPRSSFAEQYIALSRATGSVCDAFGNRVELKNIPKLLHKLSRDQFKLVWSESFCARLGSTINRGAFAIC
jgi:hypothetical protein